MNRTNKARNKTSRRTILGVIDMGQEVGKAKLFRKKPSRVIQLDISFKNVKPARMEKSTKLTNLKQATELAKTLISKEYDFRLKSGTKTRITSINTLLNKYIKDLQRRVDKKVLSLKGTSWNTKQADTTRYIVENHIRGYKAFRNLEQIYSKSVQDWVAELRQKGLSDKTISNVRIVYYDLSRFAVDNDYCSKLFPKFPKLYLQEYTKDDDGRLIEFGYATCSIQEYRDADKTIETALIKNNFRKQSDDEHNMFVMLRWMRILMDTGMRPILPKCPLYVDRRTDNFIFFKRLDKTRYTSRGQQATMRAVDELEEYYKSNGIKNESLIVNKYGFNYEDGTIRSVKTNIMKRIGWYGKTDSTERNYCFYSIRHCHINHAIEQSEPLHLLAKRVGNSIETIMKYYYKHNYYKEYDTPSPLA